MRKIVIIGPVYPYKGGISHYTGLLYRALCKTNEVEMVSYKMQYPRFLFKKEQKDYSNDQFKIEGTKFWLHTANPLNIIRTAGKISEMKPDLVIIQWWHPYFSPCYWILTRFLRNTKVLFICHNVFPHERFPLDRLLTRLALSRGDGFLLHAESDVHELQQIKKEACYKVAVHPTYNAFKLTGMDREEAREKLGLDNNDKVLLFFGYVRPYKGLKYLLKAMPQIAKKIKNVTLLVVGEFGGDRSEYVELIENLKIGAFVRCYEGYIPDKEVEKFFAACDAVVLPYVSATQSGIAQIAYGFEKPVIAANVGGLPDVVLDGKTGRLVAPENPDAIAEAVISFFDEDHEEMYKKNIEEQAYRFSWDRMRETIDAFEWSKK